jgi:DNA-binding NarL/FixJ family response regulator
VIWMVWSRTTETPSSPRSRTRGRLRRPKRLSPRERQIVTLIIDGKTRKEVAFDLGIAASTVRVLYSRAMQKLSNQRRPLRRSEAS